MLQEGFQEGKGVSEKVEFWEPLDFCTDVAGENGQQGALCHQQRAATSLRRAGALGRQARG